MDAPAVASPKRVAGAILSASPSQLCWNVWPKPCDARACVNCMATTVPSRDGSMCLPCDNTTLGIRNNDCHCRPGMVLVDRHANATPLAAKTCLPCTNGSVDASGYVCTPCPVDMLATSQGCACRPGFVNTGIAALGPLTCVDQGNVSAITAMYPLQSATLVSFPDASTPRTFTSGAIVEQSSSCAFNAVVVAILEHYFTSAAIGCYYYSNEDNNGACQTLGNLCVLQMFATSSAACSLLRQLASSSRLTTSNGISGWSATLPFLLYNGGATSILTQTSLQLTMSFSAAANPATNDTLQFMLASYTLNGTYLGLRPLSTQLLLCDPTARGNFGYGLDWLRFGLSKTFAYSCDLTTAFASPPSVLLYELYLVDNDNTLLPVPIRVLNYRDGRNVAVNSNRAPTDVEGDQLTHRFYILDAASGVASGYTTPRVISYASRLHLSIPTQASSVSALYPPVLTIEYTAIESPHAIVSSIFQVQYSSSTKAFWSVALALFVLACVVSGCSVLLQYYTWQRRHTRGNDLSASTFTTVLFLSRSSASTLSTWMVGYVVVVRARNLVPRCSILSVLTGYYLIFFKLQSAVYTLLPEHNPSYGMYNEYAPFQIVLVGAASAKTFALLCTVYDQASIEMFFLDWEEPRGTPENPSPVSIWRTILVANEWNELQTARGSSLPLTLLGLLWLLLGCEYANLASPQPLVYGMSFGAPNEYLRFANVVAWWVVLTASQWLWRWLIYERWIAEPRHLLFLDLCTLAKVSCVLLDEAYHGYYLHCRSPYAFADGSMLDLTEQLKQEAAGLTASRGLDGGPDDCQCFELFLTKAWRKRFMKLYGAEEAKAHTQPTLLHDVLERRRTNTLLAPPRKAAPSPHLVRAGHKLNKFCGRLSTTWTKATGGRWCRGSRAWRATFASRPTSARPRRRSWYLMPVRPVLPRRSFSASRRNSCSGTFSSLPRATCGGATTPSRRSGPMSPSWHWCGCASTGARRTSPSERSLTPAS
ncbi:hypothetical protein SPRG_07532 [Saprolegnia parasitica CBS 223.65]|uniref:Uncharacterized protein n=1 Tax=Saprolegnia parasitica (strain CBS 223.65) TaxID=695850 RepID=A0A067C9X5_SAPPC|nr:hypothetical protein SPRG_07532 [Saprolegnia parasitica CBS 223.65]KDO27283.1 hypothetical protein SPRG_07532 [Saprolegnia parasitica CBS 223.65]|eukprot:XP_012202058.1 hypothetical protein SPRG_07532 [Saprolegnia parasitica CBS 223.65]